MKKIMYMLFIIAIPTGSVTAQKAGYRASVRTNGWKDDNLYKSGEMPSYPKMLFI